jgi:hypothetical protein
VGRVPESIEGEPLWGGWERRLVFRGVGRKGRVCSLKGRRHNGSVMSSGAREGTLFSVTAYDKAALSDAPSPADRRDKLRDLP